MSTKRIFTGVMVLGLIVFGFGTASAANLMFSHSDTPENVARMAISMAAEDLNIALNLTHDRFGNVMLGSQTDFGSLNQELSYTEIMKLLQNGMRYYQQAVENYQAGYYKLSYNNAALADQHFLTVIYSFK
jgi:hypothetical protein